MADIEQNQGSISNDVERGAQKAVSVGKTAVQAGKTIGKAASGDWIGAAKEVAQSDGLKKVVAVLLCFSLLLMILIFFAAPMAIYEGVKAYCETLRDRWLEEYYSANTNRALAALKATITGAWDVLTDFWNLVKSGLTFNDNGVKDTDEMSGEDIKVMGPMDSLVNVYAKKMDACINKIGARQNMIESAIYASANGPIDNTGTVNGWVYNRLYSARDYWTYANLADTRYVNYGGVSVTSGTQPLTRREAVKIIALYSAMYNCDVDLIKPYSLMKWLGYYTGSGVPMSFVVGDAVTCSVKGWSGDFMPMYLIEESMHNDLDYSRYKCPAADVLLVVATDPLAGLTPLVEKTEYRRTEWVQRYAYGPQWRLMSSGDYYFWKYYYQIKPITYGTCANTIPSISANGQMYQYYRGYKDYNGMMEYYWNGDLHWYLVNDYYSWWEAIDIIQYDYTISYNLNASVGLRSADTVADLAGFYEKPKTAA